MSDIRKVEPTELRCIIYNQEYNMTHYKLLTINLYYKERMTHFTNVFDYLSKINTIFLFIIICINSITVHRQNIGKHLQLSGRSPAKRMPFL